MTVRHAAAEVRDWEPTRERLLWLSLTVTVVALPHLARVPVWLGAGFFALVGWSVGASLGRWAPPGRILRLCASLGAPVGVFLSFGTLLGRDAGVALLIILSACKLIEVRALRDAYASALLACFLVIAGFLFSQSPITGAYMLLAVALILAALVAVNDRGHTVGRVGALRIAATLMLQAAPLAVALFVLFPRLPGPLWALPKDARAGVSKLGDTMAPGTISDLSLSDAVVFRVRFDRGVPPPQTLYWRGPVLWHTDGREWSTLDAPVVGASRVVYHGEPVDYTVTLEPHFEHWLFALEMARSVPPGTVMTGDHQLRARRPLTSVHRYRVRSHVVYTLPELDPSERERGLGLPTGFHPRARALGRDWHQAARQALGPSAPSGAVERAVVARALAHFRDEPFHYTLRPPLLHGDAIDEFLFLTRRGFCEFYAAAFTVIMRAAGIPARIVTGYQGGEYNPVGDYLAVRQRDAHAWAEVWLPDRGWTRVDPTSAVSPERIERGARTGSPASDGALASGLATAGRLAAVVRAVRHSLDAVNDAWNQWVVDYDEARQRRLLDRFGIDVSDWRSVAVATLVAGAVAIGLAAAWLARRRPIGDPVLRAYRRFCTKRARRGLARRAHEGPSAFADRVVRVRPDLEADVRAITGLYVSARYGTAEPGRIVGRLKSRIARFSP